MRDYSDWTAEDEAAFQRYEQSLQPDLPSKRVPTATALSFTGSKQRIDNLWPAHRWAGWVFLVIPAVWMLIVCYYSVAWMWIWFTWPVRLLSRGKRKRKRADKQQQEMLAAIRDGQVKR